MEFSPKITLNALKLLGEELSELRQRYLELATERVEKRLARALLRLSQKMRSRELLLSRQDLAELTGTTLHTVSRTLSRWQEIGLVSSKRGRILIQKPEALLLGCK
ncbi:MAG: Crp/Fnr family transcriptional regulator [Candidatus Eremiobacteraeota bacterium]|nr:Crp/Fnr family transcriptional regulator [Candidatus Eremiobacteraeota bacterium]MCL5054516.1 Crp/Fnr family transcriptional regulator [Bacillota bacterium]